MAQNKVMRTSGLKARSASQGVLERYEALQSDFRTNFPRLFRLLGIGYGIKNEAGEIEYVSPGQAIASRQAEFGEKEPQVTDFVNLLLCSGTEGSSCYNIFYSKFKNNGAKLSAARKKAYLSEQLSEEERNEAAERDNLSVEQFELLRSQMLAIESAKERSEMFREKISPLISSDSRSLGIHLRNELNLSCKYPDELGYCRILKDMLQSQLKSAKEVYENHQAASAELQAQFEKEKANARLYDAMLAYEQSLKQLNSGLSLKSLKMTVTHLLSPPKKQSIVAVQVNELKKAVYEKIVAAETAFESPVYRGLRTRLSEDVFRAYKAIKTKNKLERRRRFPLLPALKYDYLALIDPGYWKYDIILKNGRVIFKLKFCEGEFGEIECYESAYFANLKIKKTNRSLEIEFQQRLRARNLPVQYSEPTVAHLKQIGLRQASDGKMYVMLPHEVEIKDKDVNHNAKLFFQSADPNKIRSYLPLLPDKIICGSADLNLSNPVTVVPAVVGRNLEGPLSALDYGRGYLLEKPKFLLKDGKRCSSLWRLGKRCERLTEIIREHKACERNGLSISEKSQEWLSTLKSPSDATRCRIQTWFAVLNKKVKKHHKEMMSSGYSNVSEMIRLLELLDKFDALHSAYDRIHLAPGEMMPRAPRQERYTKRSRLRLFVAKRIAAAIAKWAHGWKCRIMFLEDLESRFDRDEEKNSLMRLFSAKMLLKQIEMALEKKGIYVVYVDKRGTSKTDPRQGCPGYRIGKTVYFSRPEGLTQCDPDLVAALNILLVGLQHSIKPWRFSVGKKDQDDQENNKESNRRNKAYFQRVHGMPNPKFVDSGDGVHYEAVASVSKDQKKPPKGFLYPAGTRYITESEHRLREGQIKQRAESDEIRTEIDPSGCGPSGYQAFLVPEVLDCDKMKWENELGTVAIIESDMICEGEHMLEFDLANI